MAAVEWDPARVSDLRRALAAINVRPSRRLGQNFLVDANVLAKILEVAQVQEDEAVLEIGGGAGALTRRLAQVSSKVICIEVDRRLEPLLRRSVAAFDNVHLVFDDALAMDWSKLAGDGAAWRFVANVPYYITGPLLSRAFQTQPAFQRIVVMVQREVAQRLVARPGSKDYGALSVLAGYYARAELAFTVSPNSFWPRPKVWSAVVVLSPTRPDPHKPPAEAFFAVVRAAFVRRRKMLRNALADDPHLQLTRGDVAAILTKSGIDGDRRAETLELEEFARLAEEVAILSSQ